jgi:hypothetical protein
VDSDCSQSDISYVASGSYPSSLVVFDASTRELTVSSSTSGDADTYTVTITGSVTNSV